jgi:hypothetical protein
MIVSADPPHVGDIEIHELATDALVLVVPKAFSDGQTVDLDAMANSLPRAPLVSKRRSGRTID